MIGPAMKVTAVGICGGTGSGKTTLAAELCQALGPENTLLLCQDRYYRDLSAMTPQQRNAVNFDHPDALDFDELIRDLGRLKSGRPTQVPNYDFVTHTRYPDEETLEPKKIVLVEGLFILRPPALRAMLDYAVFLFAPADIRLARRLRRDVAQRGRDVQAIVNQYLDTVRPMHERYIKPLETIADAVIDTSENFNVDSLAKRIREIEETQL